jgi:hypothetical protein
MTLLAKDSGGTSHRWQGIDYEWPADNPVCEVPPEFATVLLSIRGGGFREVPPEPDPEPEGGGKDDGDAAKAKAAPRSKGAASTAEK